MNSFTLVLFLSFFTLLSCNQEKNRKEDSVWTNLEGDCVQEATGVSGKSGCLFRMNKSIGELEEVTYNLNFKFTSEANSMIEFYSSASADLAKGIILRIQRDSNTVRFYVRDHEKANQEVIASDIVDIEGMSYKIKHNRKSGTAKITVLDENGFQIFDTSSDLTGATNFNTFKNGGNSYGFRIKNALIKSVSF